MKHNILYIDNTTEIFGGGQISLLELLKNLDRGRFEPFVVLAGEGRLERSVRQLGIGYEIIPMPAIRPLSIFTFFGSVRRLREFVLQKNISIVHANTSRGAVYAAAALKKSGTPLVWHVRIPHRDRLLDGFLISRSRRIITVSRAVKERFGKLKDKKVELIYNGVDTAEFSPGLISGYPAKDLGINREDVVIVTSGRICAEKGFEFLVPAIGDVAKAYPQAKFLIVGGGDEKYLLSLKETVRRLKLQEHVVFAGFREDLSQILKYTDIFCLPSLTEGFNRSLLEAMASGLPVVATSVGGNIEIVQNGINGLLVPAGDSGALGRAIIELMEDRAKAKKMGLEGRKIVEKRFSIKLNTKETEQLYESVLSKNEDKKSF